MTKVAMNKEATTPAKIQIYAMFKETHTLQMKAMVARMKNRNKDPETMVNAGTRFCAIVLSSDVYNIRHMMEGI